MPKETPADSGELDARLEYVRACIDKGWSQARIVNHVRDDLDWAISDRQVRNYFAAVMEQFHEGAPKISRPALSSRSLSRLDYAYGVAAEKGDVKGMNDSTWKVVMLFSLDKPQAESWQKEAEEAGIPPSELFERVVQAVKTEKDLMRGETADD